MQYHLFETKLGFAGIAWSDDGITRFRLPDPDQASAARQFKGKTEELRVIGQKLIVATLLEGSVRKAG